MATVLKIAQAPPPPVVPPMGGLGGGIKRTVRARIDLPWDGSRKKGRVALKKTRTNRKYREAVVNGDGSLIPVVYGQVKMGTAIAFAGVKQNSLYMVCVLCEGEIQAIDEVYINDINTDDLIPAYIDVQKFTGTSGQTCLSALTAAFPSYTDNLTGIAYVYIRLSAFEKQISGFPRVTCVVRGRKVYHPSGSTSYSTNPALCLADFLTNSTYGLGINSNTIDWASVQTAVNYCNSTVNDVARRRIGLAIMTNSATQDHVQALQEYAACWLYWDSGKLRFVPDKKDTVKHTFTDDNILASIIHYNVLKRERVWSKVLLPLTKT